MNPLFVARDHHHALRKQAGIGVVAPESMEDFMRDGMTHVLRFDRRMIDPY